MANKVVCVNDMRIPTWNSSSRQYQTSRDLAIYLEALRLQSPALISGEEATSQWPLQGVTRGHDQPQKFDYSLWPCPLGRPVRRLSMSYDIYSSLLWTPAQRKRAFMLYFANVFLFFMASLFSGLG